MKKRFFGLLCALVLTLSLMAVMSMGAIIASAEDKTVSFDSSTGTLTLLKGQVSSYEVENYGGNSAVKKVIAQDGAVMPENCSMMFMSFRADSIDFSGTDWSNVTKVYDMFLNSSFTKIKMGTAKNTSKIKDFSGMFYCAHDVTSIDISTLDMTSAEDLNNMFNYCESLTDLKLPATKAKKVKNVSGLYYACKAMTNFDLSWLDTSNTTDFSRMFQYCDNLEKIDLSGLSFESAIKMNNMFDTDEKLLSVSFRNKNAYYCQDFNEMFFRCRNITSIDFSGFSTSSALSMYRMFMYCEKLTSLDLRGFDVSNATTMTNMFLDCKKLADLDISTFAPEKLTGISGMFSGCNSLKKIDLSKFNTSNVMNFSDLFNGCYALREFNITGLKTSNATNMSGMFQRVKIIKDFTFKDLDTSKVQNMSKMFWSSGVETFDLTNLKTNALTNTTEMFYQNTSLLKIYAPKSLSFANVTESKGMFGSCTSLIGGSGTPYTRTIVDKTYARVDEEGTPGYFTLKEVGYTLTLPSALQISKDAAADMKIGSDYREGAVVKLKVKSGKNVYKVTANGKEITPKDGIYTIKFASENVTVKAFTTTRKKGDVVKNDKIDNADLLAVKSHIKGIKTLTGEDLWAADVDGNGAVNNTDLIAMKAHIKGVKKLW